MNLRKFISIALCAAFLWIHGPLPAQAVRVVASKFNFGRIQAFSASSPMPLLLSIALGNMQALSPRARQNLELLLERTQTQRALLANPRAIKSGSLGMGADILLGTTLGQPWIKTPGGILILKESLEGRQGQAQNLESRIASADGMLRELKTVNAILESIDAKRSNALSELDAWLRERWDGMRKRGRGLSLSSRSVAPPIASFANASLHGDPLQGMSAGRDFIVPNPPVENAVVEGYFGPRSIMWRINGHQVVFLSGIRAFLLQSSHPLMAESAKISRRLIQAPVRRLKGTLFLMRQVMFGDSDSARKAAEEIHGFHRIVHGVLDEKVGIYEAGTPFSALDPTLQLWALASFYDTSILAYERYVRTLTEEEKDRYFAEYSLFGRLMGIPARRMPETRSEFESYFLRMLNGPELAVGSMGRQLIASFYMPPSLIKKLEWMPAPFSWVTLLAAKSMFWVMMLFTIGLMPQSIRNLYRLPWSPIRQILFTLLGISVWMFFRISPTILKYSSLWRSAQRRVTNNPL